MKNPTACLYNAARRLRYLREFPFTCSDGREPTTSDAFDYALRVVLDEFMLGGTPDWMNLYNPATGGEAAPVDATSEAS
jgi:hypothetical protein